MRFHRLVSLAFVSVFGLALGCAGEEQVPADFPPPPPPPVQAAIVAAPAPPPEPTPEEKKKAEDAKKLADDFVKLQTDHQADMARWTPDMHKSAAALAAKTYPTGHAAIQ